MSADALKLAAEQINFIALADRILTEPSRAAPSISSAEAFALACGVAQLWPIVLEAELLTKALQLPVGRAEARDAKRAAIIQRQVEIVEQLLAGLRRLPPQPEGEKP